MRRDQSSSVVGDALAWASRLIAVGVAMFLPAVVGGWLDARLGTGFLGPAGLVMGFLAGLAWLLQLAGRRSGR